MSIAPYVDVLKALIRQPSVVGAEMSFFRVLQRELEERGARVTWYAGVLVAQGSRPDSCFFSAHIDRHGLVCTGPGEYQYAAFVAGNRTDLLNNSVSEEMMARVGDRFTGETVYAYEPWSGSYRGQGTVADAYVCEHRNNLIFEVDGLPGIVAGTPVAFQDRLSTSGDRFEGQLDNVLTAAALVHAFDRGFEGTAFFTAQEEAGKSWRFLLEWFRRFGGQTNRLYVLDTSPFPTLESANAQKIVLRRRDANADFNVEATETVAAMCREQGYSYVFKDEVVSRENAVLEANGEKPRSLGSTELGRIIAGSDGLVDGTTIQVPSTGYHTMNESVHKSSVSALIDIMITLSR